MPIRLSTNSLISFPLFNYLQTHYALSNLRGMQRIMRHAIARIDRIDRTINALSCVVHAKVATKLHTTSKWRF